MVSLREARKEKTIKAIVDAAIELFSAQGRDAVTVAAIAQAAEVGERTVYRYFADKDDILFAEDTRLREALVTAFEERPADEPLLDWMRAVVGAATAPLEGQRRQLRAREAIIDANPQLRAREAGKQVGYQALVAEALEGRGVQSGHARLLAAAALVAFAEGLHRWLARSDDETLVATVVAVFGELRMLLG